jgi:hypothetical protein
VTRVNDSEHLSESVIPPIWIQSSVLTTGNLRGVSLRAHSSWLCVCQCQQQSPQLKVPRNSESEGNIAPIAQQVQRIIAVPQSKAHSQLSQPQHHVVAMTCQHDDNHRDIVITTTR